MRSVKLLLVMVLAIFGLALLASTNSANAQQTAPACTDAATVDKLLEPLSGPFHDAVGKLSATSTADDFANVIDLGIQGRNAIADVKIDPATKQACYLFQAAIVNLADEQIHMYTYLYLSKAGLKNSDAFGKKVEDGSNRLGKSLEVYRTLFNAFAAASGKPTLAP